MVALDMEANLIIKLPIFLLTKARMKLPSRKNTFWLNAVCRCLQEAEGIPRLENRFA